MGTKISSTFKYNLKKNFRTLTEIFFLSRKTRAISITVRIAATRRSTVSSINFAFGTGNRVK